METQNLLKISRAGKRKESVSYQLNCERSGMIPSKVENGTKGRDGGTDVSRIRTFTA